MNFARMMRLLLLLAIALLGLQVFGQQWQADGPCGLAAAIEGVDVKEVCSRLGVGSRSIYGPDGSPWIEIASASDCGRVRAEIERLLAGGESAQNQESAPMADVEPPPPQKPPSPSRDEFDLEKWLRRNGYASLAEAQADSDAIEKKWRQDRQVQVESARQDFAAQMRRFKAELEERLARQEALVAAELERKRQAAQAARMDASTIPAEAWAEPLAKWRAELDKVNREVETTRQALLKLVRAQQADVKLFAEWANEAQQGLERSWKSIFSLAMDAGMGMFAEGANGWAAYAKGPGAAASPEALEEYRLLFSLINRLKEAKSVQDLDSFAANEGKTGTEVLQMVRDGLVQISGLLGVEKTFPGKVLKYGALFTDQAYNLTALFQVWKNAGILEQDSAAMSEAIQRLSDRLKGQMERQRELVRKIEAGEKVEFR